MTEDIIVWRELRLNPGNRNEPSNAHIHPVSNLRNINIEIFKRRIESVLPVIVKQLAATVTFASRVTVVSTEKRGKVISPVDVILLHRIRQPLGVKHELIQLKTVGVNIVRLGRVAVRGRAEIK